MNLFWPILAGLMAVGVAFLGFQDQRDLWWRFQARWYANPEANEPSDSAFGAQRFFCFVIAAFLAFGAFELYRIQDGLSWSAGEVRNAADQAARALESKSVLLESSDDDGYFSSYVDYGVQHTREAAKNHASLAVSRGEDESSPKEPQRYQKIVERYDIAAKGRHSVCMTVTGKRGDKVTTLYDTPSSDSAEYYWRLSATVADGFC